MTYIRSITFGALRRMLRELGCTEDRIGGDVVAFIHPAERHDFIYMSRMLGDRDMVPVQLLAGLGNQLVSAGLDSWPDYEARLARLASAP